MYISTFEFWLYFGVFLVVSEALLPGLVAIFVGMGALTVSLAIYLGLADALLNQFLLWTIFSVIYLFSLRLLVMKFYPNDGYVQSIDEDQLHIGKKVKVMSPIHQGKVGRIEIGESTWNAIHLEDKSIAVGETVEIVGRKNISWIVKLSESNN